MISYLNYKFLSKLNIYGNALARYTIPYYALCRGLEVTFLNISQDKALEKYFKIEGNGGIYKISNQKGKSYIFNYSKLIQLYQEQNVKKYTKDNLYTFLDELDIKHAKANKFTPKENFKKILKSLPSFPLVVKPVNGSMGKGVYANIITLEELEEAVLAQKTDYIIENYIQGDEFRIYTIGGVVKAACKREFPHVIGNGKDNIKKYNKTKNENSNNQNK